MVFLLGGQRLMSMRKHEQTKEKDAIAFSKNIPEAAEKSPEQPPMYFTPTSTVSSSVTGECVTQENTDPPSPTEPPVSTPLPERHHVTYSNVGIGTRDTLESPVESPTTNQDGVNAPLAVTTFLPLSLQCRMCNAPPTVVTRPTVTMCGHLFCSECVLRSSQHDH